MANGGGGAQQNCACGMETLRDITTGEVNTAIGRSAGEQITTGTNNTFIGRNSGRSGSPGGQVTTQSNFVILGDSNISNLLFLKSSDINVASVLLKFFSV